MKPINGLNPGGIRSMSYNVYCDYLDRDHNILWKCRTMCSPFIKTDHTTFSNPHQLTWSQLNTKKEPEEPFLDTVIGGVALVFLFVALAAI